LVGESDEFHCRGGRPANVGATIAILESFPAFCNVKVK
jgi:hypothetical protein